MKPEHMNIIRLAIPAFLGIVLIITCGCLQYGPDDSAGNIKPQGEEPVPGEDMGPGPAAGPSFREGYYGNNLSALISEELEKYPVGELTSAETADILYIAEKEKLGRDLYLMYFDIWGIKTFLNAAGSSQADMDSMGVLIDRYGLENPVKGERGIFTDDGLQELYGKMVSSGSSTARDALNNSITIEEMKIKSLDDAVNSTEKEDLKFVYDNIRRGSENNLQAFLWNIVNMTEKYMGPGPVILPTNETDETSV